MRKLATLLVLACLTAAAHAQTPSTAEQRKWAVDEAKWLEEHPLDKDVKSHATALVKWWTEVPDLSVKLCPLLIETKNKRAKGTVVLQMMVAQGAYLIEHPESTQEEQALAAVQSSLRAYANALAGDAKVRDEFLDKLVAADKEGKLPAEYVNDALRKCNEAEAQQAR